MLKKERMNEWKKERKRKKKKKEKNNIEVLGEPPNKCISVNGVCITRLPEGRDAGYLTAPGYQGRTRTRDLVLLAQPRSWAQATVLFTCDVSTYILSIYTHFYGFYGTYRTHVRSVQSQSCNAVQSLTIMSSSSSSSLSPPSSSASRNNHEGLPATLSAAAVKCLELKSDKVLVWAVHRHKSNSYSYSDISLSKSP